ncbi:MAG: hypothetical protein E6G36_14270 [Actinobacteria bacterium]|nr:MAG: hypothetical protein E6G36_14270 [Actinomycetota bacterium]
MSLDRHEDDGENGDTRGDRQSVGAQEPRLRPRDEAAEVARVVAEVAPAVGDQRLLDATPQQAG